MAVVAQANDDADRFLRMVFGGRPLSGSVMQAAETIGAIPMRDGFMIATAKLLPFDGDGYAVFAFIETVILVNEAQGSERLSYTQRLMLNPMVRSASRELVAVEHSAIARHTTDRTSSTIEPDQRRSAVRPQKKLAYHRNLRESLIKISDSLEGFILIATQPLQSFPVLGALDATAQLIPRKDSGRTVSRRRSSLGWAFARQSAIATVIVRKDCESSVDSHAVMMVAKRLLRTPVPPAASVLRPTGYVAEVKLVPPSPLAENRIAAVVVKFKLHILACGQPWGYDATTPSHPPLPATPQGVRLPCKAQAGAAGPVCLKLLPRRSKRAQNGAPRN